MAPSMQVAFQSLAFCMLLIGGSLSRRISHQDKKFRGAGIETSRFENRASELDAGGGAPASKVDDETGNCLKVILPQTRNTRAQIVDLPPQCRARVEIPIEPSAHHIAQRV